MVYILQLARRIFPLHIQAITRRVTQLAVYSRLEVWCAWATLLAFIFVWVVIRFHEPQCALKGPLRLFIQALRNEAKGIHLLGAFILGKVYEEVTPYAPAVITTFKTSDVRLIWANFISCVIGDRCPFSRPRNVENLLSLKDKACYLSPHGLPQPNEKWAKTTSTPNADVESLLT